MRWVAVLLVSLAGIGFVNAPAMAHPHVWVDTRLTILFDKGSMSGLKQVWSFDEAYTEMAIEGLDVNNDGVYDRGELAELAKVNMEGLEEFEYFSFVRLAGVRLKLGKPSDSYLEYSKDKGLTLHFTVPFEQPVLAEAAGFSVSVYDPSYFIAFNMAKDDPVRLGEGAPAGCEPVLAAPKGDAEEVARLGEAFAVTLGPEVGITLAREITLRCP